MLNLYIREIQDTFLRENFRKLKDFLGQSLMNGEMRLFEISITGNATVKYAHNFSFTPKDVIQTSVIFSGGVGTLVWNYSSFDGTFLSITTAGMGASDRCTVRAEVGRLS